MKIEVRADCVHISGYVNATGKISSPVVTPHGRVVETIEPRAFEQAIARAHNIPMTRDHDPEYLLAETQTGTLSLYEDAIGLHADAEITDAQTVADARAGKIRGWSFGMKNVSDRMEQRGEGLPLRSVSKLDLDHITLTVRLKPFYAANSVEVRADGTEEIESRAIEQIPSVVEAEPKKAEATSFDHNAYKERLARTCVAAERQRF